jgi:hypothetical protein
VLDVLRRAAFKGSARQPASGVEGLNGNFG